ncbi:unnamed protein product, partial [Didymodactylos carnosus]
SRCTKHGTIPPCISEKIQHIKNQSVTNPPTTIKQYHYLGNKVYYISSPCCDQYNDLYDSHCNVICAPDGGLTGHGDGKCPDFYNKSTNPKVIFKDDRENT